MIKMAYVIMLDMCEEHDENAKVTALLEQASMCYLEKDDAESYADDNIQIYDTPCIILREFDREFSEKAGTVILKDVAKIDLKNNFQQKDIEEFFKRYGMKI